MEEQIQQAIEVLQQGGIVIFPTDTAFGIGCRMDDEKAIRKLFSLRRRPETQAVPVLVEKIAMARDYWTTIPEEVEQQLLRKYWPGALTVILHCQMEKVPELVRGGKDTIGLRMPDHDTALALIRGIGVPLIGTSANFHAFPTPYSFDALDKELVRLVDFVVEGECQTKLASTVIDCTVNPWHIVRDGAVTIEKI